MNFYNNWFINNGYKFLSSGLIHNVYEKDGFIYKIVKENIISFNTDDHFNKEAKCLEYLYNKGFNVVEIERVFLKGELIKDYCVLKEKRIIGICYNEQNISVKNIKHILKFIKNVEKISLKKYGVIFDEHVLSDDDWYTYFRSQQLIAYNVIKKYFSNDIIIKKYIEVIDKHYLSNVKSKLLIMDPNPENFIFAEDKMVAIDIDHPIGGDVLWQAACFYWYKETWKEEMKELDYFNDDNFHIMLIYCLIFGLATFDFLEKSSIKIDKWNYDRINRLMEEIINEKNNW